MLEHLFGSKTRVKLLAIFVHQPDTAYYVRELTRLTKLQINTVRRELQNLAGLKVVLLHPESNAKHPDKKHYRINTEHLLYPELRALLIKAELLLEHDLAEKIIQSGHVQYLALTGVFVGDQESATDMLIVGSVAKDKLAKLIQKFERELNREINFTIMTPVEFKYRKDMTDRFLYSILERQKLVVIDQLK
ncbi:MAG: hypothetical protein AAB817_01870 [Patescibacteria group bacterium]